MVMSYLQKRVQQERDSLADEHPDWVSDRNASLRAWHCVEELKKEKALYIKRHHKATDYLTKKNHQIKGSDIARAINISRASLMNTSSYSPYFRQYLDKVNSELASAKKNKLQKSQKMASRGPIRSTKDELVLSNTQLRKRVSELEAQKTEELVRYAFDQLPLPVRKKLGIN